MNNISYFKPCNNPIQQFVGARVMLEHDMETDDVHTEHIGVAIYNINELVVNEPRPIAVQTVTLFRLPFQASFWETEECYPVYTINPDYLLPWGSTLVCMTQLPAFTTYQHRHYRLQTTPVPSPLFSPLSLNITREVAAYLPPNFPLLWVEKDHIWLYDLLSGTCSAQLPLLPSQTPFQVSRRSGWVVLDSGRVLVCGGGDGRAYTALEVWKTAYVVHRSGQVDSLSSLAYSHSLFGIVSGMALCTSLAPISLTGTRSVSAMDWQSLPDMKESRTLFTPAVWRAAAYLCGAGLPRWKCGTER